ncbi:DUF2249 domain-containing protein [Alkalimarinus sediminis]|uniref:DUF2249 domain-containing protein n=1 Tax=Alkalimarinus sediminis TaxID=1632866 RepID=A0A9E8HGE9_9ALTE|nr:DUF2249 domain-containing protein [Alkalimarinus sediminis]UZW74190.1 DUF2249 domain-containing protein [Alkalimarinus sediminis]
MKVIDLDVSELEPPEPYALAVQHLVSLPDESILNMIHRQEPFPLYQTADEMGFFHQTTFASEGVVHIYFWHKDDRAAADYLSKQELLG